MKFLFITLATTTLLAAITAKNFFPSAEEQTEVAFINCLDGCSHTVIAACVYCCLDGYYVEACNVIKKHEVKGNRYSVSCKSDMHIYDNDLRESSK